MSSSPAPDLLRRRHLAPLLALLLAGPAAADPDGAASPGAAATGDPAGEDPGQAADDPQAPADGAPTAAIADEPGEVITVYGEAEVQRNRAALESLIVDQGYLEGKRRGDRTIFRPEVPWKPSVIVHDEGFVELKRSPIRWMPPGRKDRPLNNLWCVPPFTPMCIRIGGLVVAESKLTPQKTRVLEEIHDQAERWRQAIVDQATWTRVNDEVPARIQATWETGAPLEGDGPPLEDRAARRRALLAFWASRSDTREGDMVAQVVADFIAEVVQSSPWPVTAEELAEANRAAAGKRTLRLELPTPEPAPGEPAPPGAAPPPDTAGPTDTPDGSLSESPPESPPEPAGTAPH